MELKIPPGATSSKSLKLFLDEALSGAAGQEVIVDIDSREDAWIPDTLLRAAGKHGVSRIVVRNPPESYKGEAVYLANRAEAHGVDVGLEEVASLADPIARARHAYERGDSILQLVLPIAVSERTSATSIATQSRTDAHIGKTLSDIEEIGWKLIEAGFVFQETGQVSRDKFLTSGQSTSTTGETVGIYVFRRDEARDM